MTLTKKKLPALLLALAMLIALIPVFNVKAGAAAFSWMNGAKSVKSGSTYSTTMAKNGDWSTYKISVKHDGVIKLDLTAKADCTAVDILNSYGEKMYITDYDYKTGRFHLINGTNINIAFWDSESGKSVTRATCPVEKGTYYIRFAHRNNNDNVCTEGSGKISFKLTFPTTASEKDDAKQLFSGKSVTVKSSYKDEKQIYAINVRKSGELNLNFTTEMNEASVKLYEKNFEDQVEITNVSKYGGEVIKGGKGFDYIYVGPWTQQLKSFDYNSRDYSFSRNGDNYYCKKANHSHFGGTISYNVNKGIYYLVIENTDSICRGKWNSYHSVQVNSTRTDYYSWVANCSNADLYSGPNSWLSMYDHEVMTIKADFPDAGEIKTTPSIDPDISMSLKKGKTLNAAALCELTGTIKWTTSNKNVATVSTKGKVTAKKAGTVYITGTSGKKTFIIKLTIK